MSNPVIFQTEGPSGKMQPQHFPHPLGPHQPILNPTWARSTSTPADPLSFYVSQGLPPAHGAQALSSFPSPTAHNDVAVVERRRQAPAANQQHPQQTSCESYACVQWYFAIPMQTIVCTIFGWSWYVHVLLMDKFLLQHSFGLAIADLVAWHVLFALALISYFRTVFTPPGYTVTSGRSSAQQQGLNTSNAEQSYCQVCCSVKPERCHHCRICNRCVEKMDHHCPWVCNCVGKFNHKFFVLFLLYTAQVAIYNTVTLVLWLTVSVPQQRAIAKAQEGANAKANSISDDFGELLYYFHVWANAAIVGFFGLILVCFGGYHLWLVSRYQIHTHTHTPHTNI
jgi:hypothetical protein